MTEPRLPKNGILSGMVLTWGTAAAAAVIGLLLPGVREVFEGEASPALLNGFLISIGALIVHKIESYFWGEYDACPVYRTMGTASYNQQPRQAAFMNAIPILMVMLLIVAVVMRGSPWVLLFFVIWAGQGIHEWHHLAKTLVARRYYPGVFTALLFTASVNVLVFPAWVACLGVDAGLWYKAYYGVQPVIFLAFVLEHRRWLAAARRVDPQFAR